MGVFFLGWGGKWWWGGGEGGRKGGGGLTNERPENWSCDLSHWHILPPDNSPNTFFFCKKKFCWLKKICQNHQNKRKTSILSSHGNIRRPPFNQRSPQLLEVGVLNCHRHTDRQTHRQADMGTLWPNLPSGSGAISVKIQIGKMFFLSNVPTASSIFFPIQ